jgi:hypothetical protein
MGPDRTARRVAGAVVAVTALASGYLMVVGLLDPSRLLPGAGAPAARVLGGYEAVRTVVLAGAMVWLLLSRAWGPLRLLLILNALAQSGDAVVAAAARHPVTEIIGPLCFAIALAYAARRLARGRAPAPAPAPAPARDGDRDRRQRDPRRDALLLGAPRLRRQRTP